jgi:hypothetical protein
MRILVTIAHYFKTGQTAHRPLTKIAALNAQIVGLHRYFGSRRLSFNPQDPQATVASVYGLDIVIITQRDANLLDQVGINSNAFSVEYCDLDQPMLLPFEAQRIMRDRVGQYDVYAYMEDDLVVDDPAFFEKIVWFSREFGPDTVLLPIRYEMASTGTPAKLSLATRLSGKDRARFQRSGLPRALTGRWNGTEQVFRLPNNPHAGFFAVTDDQLRTWISAPTFYDRDASFAGGLESAATLAPGKVFGLYMAAEPDPWFLQLEHFGAPLAHRDGQGGPDFGKPLLLSIAEAAADGIIGARPLQAARKLAMAQRDVIRLQAELDTLKGSRSRLAKALLSTMWRKR